MLAEALEAIYQDLRGHTGLGKVVLGLKPPVTEGFAGVCVYPRTSDVMMTWDARRSEHEVVVEIHVPLSESVTDFVNRVEEVTGILAGRSEITRIRVEYNPGNWAEIQVTIPEMENISRN